MIWDALVVGSGPNGPSAAITLSTAGRSIVVLEEATSVGSAGRSEKLTLEGFGRYTDWAYSQVPQGFTVNMTESILRHIEHFARGCRDLVLATHSAGPAQLEAADRNFLGGDLGGGSYAGRQMLFRPFVTTRTHYRSRRIFLGWASSSPGGGVWGMGGYPAARSAPRRGSR